MGLFGVYFTETIPVETLFHSVDCPETFLRRYTLSSVHIQPYHFLIWYMLQAKWSLSYFSVPFLCCIHVKLKVRTLFYLYSLWLIDLVGFQSQSYQSCCSTISSVLKLGKKCNVLL